MCRISELELELQHQDKKAAQTRSLEELFENKFSSLMTSFTAMQESQSEAKGKTLYRARAMSSFDNQMYLLRDPIVIFRIRGGCQAAGGYSSAGDSRTDAGRKGPG